MAFPGSERLVCSFLLWSATYLRSLRDLVQLTHKGRHTGSSMRGLAEEGAWRSRYLQLEEAFILASCHLPHTLLGTGSSGAGTVSTGTGSAAGKYLEPAFETRLSHQPLPKSPVIWLQHRPLPRPIRNTAVPNQMMTASMKGRNGPWGVGMWSESGQTEGSRVPLCRWKKILNSRSVPWGRSATVSNVCGTVSSPW